MFTGADGSFDSTGTTAQLMATSAASSRASRCVTTRPRARSPSVRARAVTLAWSGQRTFNVRWIKEGGKAPADLGAAARRRRRIPRRGGDRFQSHTESPQRDAFINLTVVKPSPRGVFSTNKNGSAPWRRFQRASVPAFHRSSCWWARRVIWRVASSSRDYCIWRVQGFIPGCRIIGVSLDQLDAGGFRNFARESFNEFWHARFPTATGITFSQLPRLRIAGRGSGSACRGRDPRRERPSAPRAAAFTISACRRRRPWPRYGC